MIARLVPLLQGECRDHCSGFGLPTYAKDALGRERWFEYDRLGRMTARVDKEEGSESTYRTTWTWDLGATGKGKLAEVEPRASQDHLQL
ncbi:hypothetical protein WME89_52400 [Sorangium sp. So ce321]|uniref:hypothetical protein n=1 Tax=Sorangium sp. So ce321 TaxID=3133300 RepID=UPI003F60928B